MVRKGRKSMVLVSTMPEVRLGLSLASFLPRPSYPKPPLLIIIWPREGIFSEAPEFWGWATGSVKSVGWIWDEEERSECSPSF